MAFDAEQFAAYLILQGKTESTVRNYRALFQKWLDWCKTNMHDPMQPNALTVRRWSEQVVKPSYSMRAQAAAVIGHMCDALGLDTEVVQAIDVPRRPRRSRRALSIEHADKLETTAHESGLAGTAVLCGLYTAARRAEIAGFEWDRIKFKTVVLEDGTEVLTGTIEFWRPKNRDWHTVPLHPVLARHLYERQVEGEQWLFPGRHGGHVSPATIWEWCLWVASQAGIGKVTPHQLRHTALTTINDMGGDLRAAQQMAGHESPTTTAIYTRKDDEKMQQVVSMMDYRSRRNKPTPPDDEQQAS